jgi:prepilin peptidase CpaA
LEKYCLLCGLVIATIGAINDVHRRMIPNWLTYNGILSGLGFRVVSGGWLAFKAGLIGLLIGGGIFYVLFVAGGMGGGDVKLMSAVSAWAGDLQTIQIVEVAAIAGGVLAIVCMVRHKQMRLVLQNSLELLRHHLVNGLAPHPLLNVRKASSAQIPYGLAIVIGTAVCACSAFWRG